MISCWFPDSEFLVPVLSSFSSNPLLEGREHLGHRLLLRSSDSWGVKKPRNWRNCSASPSAPAGGPAARLAPLGAAGRSGNCACPDPSGPALLRTDVAAASSTSRVPQQRLKLHQRLRVLDIDVAGLVAGTLVLALVASRSGLLKATAATMSRGGV